MSTPEQIAADAIRKTYGTIVNERKIATIVAALREAGMFVDLDATETRLTPEQVAHIKVEREEARAERDALAAQLEAARQAADEVQRIGFLAGGCPWCHSTLTDLDALPVGNVHHNQPCRLAALLDLLAPVEPQPEEPSE